MEPTPQDEITLRARLRPLKALFHRFQRFLEDIPKLGLRNAWRLALSEPAPNPTASPSSQPRPLRLPHYRHPFWIRPGGSDPLVVRQIFTDEEYGQITGLNNPNGWILDCGANIGCSTLYFCRHFPHAKIVAIEPDPENFALLSRNLAPYSDRVTLFQGAIWPTQAGLTLQNGTMGGGMEWARQVQESGEGQVQGLPLDAILARFGIERIELLKMDIEGAEEQVFSGNAERWLDRVHNLVIEIHGEKCREQVFAALAPYHFQLSHFGELTYFQQLSRTEKKISCEA